MRVIWYTSFIRAVPEAIGLILISLAVMNERRSLKPILLAGIVCGLSAFTMRMLPVKFGINFFLTAILDTLFLSILLKVKIQKAFKGIISSLIVLTILEVLTLVFILYVLKIDQQLIYSNGISTILSGVPSVVMLYIIASIINSINKKKGVNRDKVENVGL